MTRVSGRDAHRADHALMSIVLVVLGVAMIVRTLARRRRALALGILLGVLFVAGRRGPRCTSRAAMRSMSPPGEPDRSDCDRGARSTRAAVRDRLHGRSRARSTSRSAWSPTTRSGLTPLVFLVAGLFFALAAMTYVEGASLHQDRAGVDGLRALRVQRAVELRRRLGDAARLRDPASRSARSSATNYLAPFWSELGEGAASSSPAWRSSLYVARAQRPRLLDPRARSGSRLLVAADIGVQVAADRRSACSLFFDADALIDPIHLGPTPTWTDVIFALDIATVAFTGLESASGLAGEVSVEPARPASGWSG